MHQGGSQAFGISDSCFRYERKLDAENAEVATWLIKLRDNHRNWGFGLCCLYLRNVNGFKWNHKRVYRIYKDLELNLRIKPSKWLARDKPEALTVPQGINQVWSNFPLDRNAYAFNYILGKNKVIGII